MGADSTRLDADIEASFNDFWDFYPRREAKAAAKKVYARALAKTTPEAMAEAVRLYAEEWKERPAKDRRFIPHPTTWLNQERWHDVGQSQAVTPTVATITEMTVDFRSMMMGRLGIAS